MSGGYDPNDQGDQGGQGGYQPPSYGGGGQQRPQYGDQPQYGGQPQYGQPQYGQPQYGQPQYGGGVGQPQETDSSALTALIVFIARLLICYPAGIVGLILANGAKRKIDQSGGRLGGAGMVTAAKVISWIAIALTIIVLIVVIIVAIGDAFSASNTSGY